MFLLPVECQVTSAWDKAWKLFPTYEEGEDKQHRASGPSRAGVASSRDREEADDDEDDEHGFEAKEVERAATKVLHQKPRGDSAKGANAILSHVQVKSKFWLETGLLVELGRSAHKARAAKCLNHPDHGGNLCTAEVGAFEAV